MEGKLEDRLVKKVVPELEREIAALRREARNQIPLPATLGVTNTTSTYALLTRGSSMMKYFQSHPREALVVLPVLFGCLSFCYAVNALTFYRLIKLWGEAKKKEEELSSLKSTKYV